MRASGLRAISLSIVALATILVPRARAVDIDFEASPANTVFGLPDDAPGDDVLDENGVTMSVESFVLGSSDLFFFATVKPAGSIAFDTQALALDNISVRFDLADVGFDVDLITFDVADFGGASNLSVNDQSLHVLDAIADLPADVTPDVTASFLDGTVTLSGPIQSFLIGGQELVIDNVSAVPEPAAGLLLAAGSLAAWRLRRRKRRA